MPSGHLVIFQLVIILSLCLLVILPSCHHVIILSSSMVAQLGHHWHLAKVWYCRDFTQHRSQDEKRTLHCDNIVVLDIAQSRPETSRHLCLLCLVPPRGHSLTAPRDTWDNTWEIFRHLHVATAMRTTRGTNAGRSVIPSFPRPFFLDIAPHL